MIEPVEVRLKQSIDAVAEMYYHLVLLAGPSGTGKTAVMKALAEEYKTTPINLNLALSEELLQIAAKHRPHKVSRLVDDILYDKGKIVFLDNLEILFDADLKQDPLRLLQNLSRNITIVATWNGFLKNGKLIYGAPDHHEYKSYDVSDSLIVSITGDQQ